MRCGEAKRLLNRYVDGELDLRAREELDRHILSCPACEAELSDLRRMSEVFVPAREQGLSWSLWPRFDAKLARELAPRRYMMQLEGLARHLVPVAAVLLAIVVVLWALVPRPATAPPELPGEYLVRTVFDSPDARLLVDSQEVQPDELLELVFIANGG